MTKFEIDITCEFFVSGDRESGYRYFEGTCQLLEDYREMSGMNKYQFRQTDGIQIDEGATRWNLVRLEITVIGKKRDQELV